MTTEAKSTCNLNSLSRGTLFIRDDVPLPSRFRFQYRECLGWKQLFDVNNSVLERSALDAGWHFASIASLVTSTGWGTTRQSAVRRALGKIMETVNGEGFNSFEINGIAVRGFLSIHWARLRAIPRHVSPSPFLKNLDSLYYPRVTDNAEEIFWRASEVEPTIKGI